jgi:DNA-binding PadR family transcriptional regulator
MLLALAEGDLHGQAIMQAVFEQSGGRVHLWPAMLYRNLDRLIEEGLILEVARPAPAAGRPRFFRVTPAGRKACQSEAERLATVVRLARAKLLTDRG